MSNQNWQSRNDGNYRHDRNKGFSNTQKKFVPKAKPNSVPTESQGTSTLSNSLGKCLSRQSDEPATSSSGSNGPAAAVRPLQKKGSVPRRTDGGNFMNYLPQDEAVAAGFGAEEGGLDPVESQRVVDHLNRELSRLLRLSPRDFWREVASDSSLVSFLESFLQFRSRWYDLPYRGVKGIVAGVIVGELELSRRVFMLLYRLSSNRDPSARATDTLSPKDHSVLLQEKKFLDLPKLLDICAIYAHDNQDLTRSLVINALKAQPWLHDDFAAALSHFLKIVHTMNQRCSASLEVLFSSQGSEDHGSHRLDADYLEVMDFINDAIVSMVALVSAYKPAAVYFSCLVETSYGNKDLLSTLATLHDSLLPSLCRGLELISTFGSDEKKERSGSIHSNIMLSLKMLSARIAEFGWRLLDDCYLSDEVIKSNFPLPAVTKMLPANVEDPVIRADILVQTLTEISGGYSPEEGRNSRTFLQNVEKNHKILDRVQLLQSTGWIVMDGEQFQYLTRIMKHDSESGKQVLPCSIPTSHEDTAIVESKISQIKDIFPDFGKGFISACLEVYNQNPEDVIQRILEGTLHEDLQALDTSLEIVPLSKSAPPVSRGNDKGKGKLSEPVPPPSSVNGVQPVRPTVGPSPSSSSSSAAAGRFVRKSTTTANSSSVLDSRDESNLAKTAALISQMEYDDEYDDSFDDLGLSVADSGGLEEAEISSGDKIREKPWGEGQSGGSSGGSNNSSRWQSQKKPQFYVKDGKNYSYKVSGSVAVANYNDAVVVNEAQKELIHGLGRGGNLPMGAVKRLEQSSTEEHKNNEPSDDSTVNTEVEGGHMNRGRGRGRRGGGRSNNYRKDQALKKRFPGQGGGF